MNILVREGWFLSILLLSANYTLKSTEINNFMALHKRSGVPLNVLYGAGKKDGIVLPEMLSFQDIVDAINKSSIND